MTQYCRYCTHAVLHGDDYAYCSEKGKFFAKKQVQHSNKCRKFLFNEIDVFDFEQKYQPKEKKTIDENQVSLWG